jgi:Sad1 / UNC-like C-terminal
MPPRRATRAVTSTPTRALPSAARRASQDNTPGRPTTLESTPLPDLEAELSFAYGSSNTKPLPLQLVAQKKTTFARMAENLHSHVVLADQNLTAHVEEAGQYGTASASAAARAARAARRSSERDSESVSRANSVEAEGDQTPAPPVTRRRKGLSTETASHWLQDIEEEANSQDGGNAHEEADMKDEAVASKDVGQQAKARSSIYTLPVANSRRSSGRETTSPSPGYQTEQSTMPDVNRVDQNYTQERDLHIHGASQPPTTVAARFMVYVALVHDFFLMLWGRICSYCSDYSLRKFGIDCYKLVGRIATVFMLLMVCLLLRSWMCDWYCGTPWSISPSRAWHFRVNEMCRYNSLDGRMVGNTTDMPTIAVASHVGRLMKQIQHQDKVVQDLRMKDTISAATINDLTERQTVLTDRQLLLADRQGEILKLQSDLQSKVADSEAAQASASARSNKSPFDSSFYLAPIFRRINYAAPAVGAIVDPYRTSSPPKKEFPLYQRLLLGALGVSKYESRPSSEALTAWNDIGDCWCAPFHPPYNKGPTFGAQGKPRDPTDTHIQLTILLAHDIFPDEIVIEHLPVLMSPFPGTTPKDIEIWGDFSHMTQAEFGALTMGPHGLAEIEFNPQLGLLGRFRYDAVANEKEGRNVQIFRLDYNQDLGDEYSTRKIVVRVNKAWGEELACLYRVRVHGVPVHPHPGMVVE